MSPTMTGRSILPAPLKMNHAGKGDFTEDLFVLSTTTSSPERCDEVWWCTVYRLGKSRNPG